MHKRRPVNPTMAHSCQQCMARTGGICGSIMDDELPRLRVLSTIVEVRRGQTVIYEGDPAKYVFVIIHGSAKLYKALPDGRSQIIGFGKAHALLGLTCDATYDFTVVASEDIRMCRIGADEFHSMAGELHAMGLRLLSMAMADLDRTHNHALLLGRKTALEKVATFLLLHVETEQCQSTSPLEVHLPLSRMDIADYLGTTPETLSRSLWALDRGGVITVTGPQSYTIRNHSRLEAIAHALPL